MDDMIAFGVGGYIDIEGKKYHLTPLTALDYAEARALARSFSPDPMEGVIDICKEVHPEVGKVLIAEAYREKQKWGSLTEGHGAQWAGSPEGEAFFLHRMIRTHHPEITLEWCVGITSKMQREKREKMMERIAEISGLMPDPTPTSRGSTLRKRKKR